MDSSDKLSSREREVVALLQEGKSNKLIASSLNITERTVEFHLKNIYEKFHVSSRVELMLKLGESTVADAGEKAENWGRLDLSNRSKSLREAISRIGREFRMNNVMNTNARSEGSPMAFFESILICLKKYAEFNGRASRSEFWWFTLFVLLVDSALAYLSTPLASAFLVVMLLPLLAAGARRLHDSGNSGWSQLFILAPVAGIVLVGILWARPSKSPVQDDSHSA